MCGCAGGHINPAVTFGLFLARKVSLIRAVLYMVAQCAGAICGVGLVKGFQKAYYVRYGGGANEMSPGYSKGTGLGAEIIGTFVLVYTVFAATDPKRNARDSHVPVCALLVLRLLNIDHYYKNLANSRKIQFLELYYEIINYLVFSLYLYDPPTFYSDFTPYHFRDWISSDYMNSIEIKLYLQLLL